MCTHMVYANDFDHAYSCYVGVVGARFDGRVCTRIRAGLLLHLQSRPGTQGGDGKLAQSDDHRSCLAS